MRTTKPFAADLARHLLILSFGIKTLKFNFGRGLCALSTPNFPPSL
jgi:hypothetical protein